MSTANECFMYLALILGAPGLAACDEPSDEDQPTEEDDGLLASHQVEDALTDMARPTEEDDGLLAGHQVEDDLTDVGRPAADDYSEAWRSSSSPPAGAIIGDNDWSGSTAKFGGSYYSGWGSWKKVLGNEASYWYGDLRYTTTQGVQYTYWWQKAPKNYNLFGWFYVRIPYSQYYSMGRALYTVECGPYKRNVYVDQHKFGPAGKQWVELGMIQVPSEAFCRLTVKKSISDTQAIAADGVAVVFGEWIPGP